MPSIDQALSLAAVVRCCQLVHELATQGYADDQSIDRMVSTILDMNPDNVSSLVGGVSSVTDGLKYMLDLKSVSTDKTKLEVARMTMTALQLQKSVRRSPAIEESLGSGIEEIIKWGIQAPFDQDAFSRINGVYQRSISGVNPSIVVRGSQGYLQNPLIVNKVRSLLLAAVRCAYLWHQVGGRMWRFALQRKQYGEVALYLLSQDAEETPDDEAGS